LKALITGFVSLNQKQILMKNLNRLLLIVFVLIFPSLLLHAQVEPNLNKKITFADSNIPFFSGDPDPAGNSEAILSMPCDYQIALYSANNGWQGSSVSVYVDGTLVLANLTLASGAGPLFFDFPLESAQEVTSVYSSGTASEDDSYTILNSLGLVVYTDGAGNTAPTGIGPGELTGLCPWGNVEGYVFDGDGLIIAGATVEIETLSVSVISGADGYYILLDIPSGEQILSASKSGYNQNQQSITVLDGATIVQDFTLAQPTMIINPLTLDETLHPYEAKIEEISILNNGDGPLDWQAEISFISDADGFVKNPGNEKPVIIGNARHDGQGALLEIAAKGTPTDGGSRDLFECNSGSFFGNSPFGTNNAYQSQYGGTYQAYQSCTGIGGAWNVVTFWGVYSSGTPTTDEFFIGIYEDGAQPGAEIASYLLTLDPIPTGETLMGFDIYQYIATIDVRTEANFFISCQATAEMFWCNSPTGSGTAGTGPSWSSVDPLGLCIEGSSNNNWLTLTQYQGNVAANGGTNNLFAIFNASGFSAGDYVTANITFTSTPDVGTIVVPVSMTVAGEPYLPPENLDVVLDEINGTATVSWELATSSGFQYFKIDRNNMFIASTTGYSFFDYMLEYGTYCYMVTAVYDQGASAYAGPSCITWAEPGLLVNPDVLEAWVWTEHYTTSTTTIYNTGIGGLSFLFPMYDNADVFACDHEIVLTDDYGDGWSGSTIDLYVNGSAVLTGITLASGAGPESFSFNAQSGGQITTVYNINGNQNPNENAYEIFDGEGNLIATDGAGGTAPIGIPAGTCYAFCPQPSFITYVEPSSGFIAEGQSQEITITYNASQFDPGDYDEWLYLESNDPDHLTDSIFNTMHVTMPGQFAGNISDLNSGMPINGVKVMADMHSTLSDPNGDYLLYVDPDNYDVHFEKTGYQSIIIMDTVAVAGEVTIIDIGFNEALYGPGWVRSAINDDDTECLVEWSIPWGQYEIIYDDATVDDYLIYTVSGNAHAVKFTPAGYPAKIKGGTVYVGDGSFPLGSDFIGSTFGLAVFDDDGTDGLPGTLLDTAEVTVGNHGWITVLGLYSEIEDGDFYLAMFQGSLPPNAAPIGIDQTAPTVYRSYSYIAAADQWTLSPYQDFMIHAIVSGPQSRADMLLAADKLQPPKPLYKHYISTGKPCGLPGYVKSGEIKPILGFESDSDRAATGYKLVRFSNFSPEFCPLLGDTTVILGHTDALSYTDMGWAGLDEGWYAYGVAARYNQGGNVWSDYSVSNITGHLKRAVVSIELSTSTGMPADSAEIILCGLDFPYQIYSHYTNQATSHTFYPVWKGCYGIFIHKIGYERVDISDSCFFEDETLTIELQEKKYTPRNLYVDPLTSIATWDEPLVTALLEDFESDYFPPNGWTSSTESYFGWFRTEDGSSQGFEIPEWDSYYACASDDMGGSGADGSVDYLITPALDLREANGYALTFDHYFTGEYGQLASVEISFDAGENWIVEKMISPSGGNWAIEEVDLSAYSHDLDIPHLWIAFHADDAGEDASGWAIDNVEVSVGGAGANPPEAYHVFLDDDFIAETSETTYQYLNLVFGVEYTASVGALYSSGLSDKDYYTWISEWLFPGGNIAGVSIGDSVHLVWDPPYAPWFDLMSVETRKNTPNPNIEYSPTVREIKSHYPAGRNDWDTQFQFPCYGDDGGEAGVESDGSYIYTSVWNSGDGAFYRYELDGTFVGEFTVSGGCHNIRDLAYNGEYFYGSNASTYVWEMDFDNEVVVSRINAPIVCRAIAYDHDMAAFWSNNWSDQITLFDKNGLLLNTFDCGAYGNYYGFAWDKHTQGGPYLYGFSQDGSGAVIVEIEIATGTETGFAYDAIGFSTTGNGLAGGLFIQNHILPYTCTLGGIIQNETIFGLEFGTDPPVSGQVPENLLGFNVYRNQALQEYVEYQGEEQMSWWQYGLLPGSYNYEVTAIYDLEPYGFPGQQGESMLEGPVEVQVSYGFELPFFEDWESGTFLDNDWETQCDNWEIDSMIGNPGFSSKFIGTPEIENYDCGIISFPINASDMLDGDIFLDFDLKIDDRFDTVESEKLVVRIWTSDGWMDKKEFVANGDMDWQAQHKKISVPAKDADFRVGFFAVGENSTNINAWFIDNVHVYQMCRKPSQLTSQTILQTYDMTIIELNWIEPYADYHKWLSYNDGSFEYSFASDNGGAGLAQMFTPEYYPVTITKVRYFNSAFEQYMQECEIYVLSGDGEEIISGPYFVSNGPPDDWVTIDIEDITLESGTFMVATFNVDANGPNIGVDDSFYDGSLYFGSIGNFDELGTLGYYYVGSHEAYVDYVVGDNVIVNSILRAPEVSNSNSISDIKLLHTDAQAPVTNRGNVTGYNIWRNDEMIASNWPDVQYFDTVYETSEYCYYISALYSQCESDTLGYVCETFYNGGEEKLTSALKIYPNPTNEKVWIVSPLAIERITIVNNIGNVVKDLLINDQTNIEVEVSGLEPGIYILKVVTAKGTTMKKITIGH
jgi:type IX secretion system substrate protein/carboxypeptidase family protein